MLELILSLFFNVPLDPSKIKLISTKELVCNVGKRQVLFVNFSYILEVEMNNI